MDEARLDLDALTLSIEKQTKLVGKEARALRDLLPQAKKLYARIGTLTTEVTTCVEKEGVRVGANDGECNSELLMLIENMSSAKAGSSDEDMKD